ncbi:MAG: heparinase II/III family protein [Abitibacteriaceae bacterium]|nr:heparinase II/III family protein [Abditibacteriaceae bacterium]MBV9867408.1 heparinase II/III family protein [Abditibacteriaceae bacterium]
MMKRQWPPQAFYKQPSPAVMSGFLMLALLKVAAAAPTTPPSGDGATARPVALKLPTEANVLTTLRAGHPRLILLPEDITRIKNFIANDATARGYYAALVRNGEKILTQPPVERVLIGPRLLDKSRTALDRIYTLGLLYRLDGDRKWADRATQEMLKVATFSDWHPDHFLDVAEMTHAVAIGYDWFYDALSPADRATIKAALVEKGLRASEKAYQTHAWWTKNAFNWNNVCNGGTIVGALAVADEEPILARYLLVQATAGLPHALASYAPDGAWSEGPGYWGYATMYTVAAFAALQSALGTDFGLSTMPGFSEAGLFRLQGAGPTGLFFNFADAGERAGDEPSLFWLARRFDSPLLAAGAREAAGKNGSARDLMWYDPRGTKAEIANVGLDSQYKAAHLAFFRSAWNDRNALYVGFKGGDNKANHSHLDLGTFVLDALGQRWAIDLGGDEYNLPDYFGKLRWTYYRLRTEGHNTLTLDGQNQDPKAAAPLIAYHSSPDGGLAVADLSAAYALVGATRVQRGVAMLPGRHQILVQDEIAAKQPVDVVWSMHTKAAVTINANDAHQATLTQGGATLQARLLEPAGASFSVQDVNIPAPQHPSPGVKKLQVHLPEKITAARIVVLLTPGIEAAPVPPVTALAQWEKAAR